MKYFLILLPALLVSNAAAADTNTRVQVFATILPSCTSTGTSLNFEASIDPSPNGSAIDATAALGVTCTSTTPYLVALSAGANVEGSNTGARTMKNGNVLRYQLYLDAARSKIWGEGSSAFSGTGTGTMQRLTIYGRLPSLDRGVHGIYRDTPSKDRPFVGRTPAGQSGVALGNEADALVITLTRF